MVLRLSWGVADQAMSSLTNFAVSIYVVHVLGAVQFGAFSLAYVTYSFALNASRGLATDPLMVRFSGTDLPTWRRAVAGCTGTAATVGLAAGACVLAAAAVLGGTARAAFLALGLTLPGLLLQDSWRYSFFALGRGSQAFLNDTIWAAALLPALVFLRVTGHANVFWFVFAWGAAAAVAAAAGPLQARVVPRLSGARGVAVDGTVTSGPATLRRAPPSARATQLRTYGIGLILGLAAVGIVQAAATLMGPITILFLGMSLVAIPEAARVLRRSPAAPAAVLPARQRRTGCGGARVGNRAAGRAAERARGLAARPDLAANVSAGAAAGAFRDRPGASLGAGAGLHGLGAARRSLRAMILMSAAYLILGLGGRCCRRNPRDSERRRSGSMARRTDQLVAAARRAAGVRPPICQ